MHLTRMGTRRVEGTLWPYRLGAFKGAVYSVIKHPSFESLSMTASHGNIRRVLNGNRTNEFPMTSTATTLESLNQSLQSLFLKSTAGRFLMRLN